MVFICRKNHLSFLGGNIKKTFSFWRKRWFEVKKSKLFRQTLLIFGANVFNALINIVSVIIIVRALGPSLYGILAIALSVVAILGELGDLGLSTAVLRFVPKYLAFNTRKARSILKAAWEIKLISAFVIASLGIAFAPTLAINFFHQPALINLFRIAFAGAFGILLSQFTIATLQAKNKFPRMLLVQILPNFIKFLAVFILIYFKILTPITILTIFVASFYLSFLVGYFLMPKHFLTHSATYAGSRKELFNFAKWIFIAVIFGSLYRQVDILMLGHYLSDKEVGIYAAAYQLTLPFTILTASLQTAFFPRLTAIKGKRELKKFSRKIIFYLCLIFIICLPLALVIKSSVGFLFGVQYLAAAPIFLILFFRALLLGFRGLVTILLCAFDKPQVISLSDAFRFFLSVALLIYAIPRFGLTGAAYSVLIVAILGLMLESMFLVRFWRGK